MAIPADILQWYFYEYRSRPTLKKKTVMDIVLFFATTPKKQEELLTRALDYDILNPVADGRENILRSSEISVSLFKYIFKSLPRDIHREEFLSAIFSNLSEESKERITQRLYIFKTGENVTKIIAPFTLAYHLFLTMVFFDVSALSIHDFSRYSALLMEIQRLKNHLRYDNIDITSLGPKLHNAVTELEKFKLNFLEMQYGLTIEILSRACQNLYLEPEALVIRKEDDLLSLETGAEHLQLQILLELNKRAYGLNNTFGQLRFNEAKPRAHSDKAPKAPPHSVSLPERALSFWRERVSSFNLAENNEGRTAYYHFAP
ncbi:MAG: hypothetical protein K0R48_146 [Gammaproteobacteria bacterium]|jgi:hypothetical protein|nr:hypothetical protein [Gammaproteobacteria bacterium]